MTQAPVTAIPAESREDAELIAAALQHSDEFGRLYERYLPRVYRYLLSRCGSRDEAADLTQIAFTRAYYNLARYLPGQAPFAAWLFRIARNAAGDAHRKRRVTVPWDGLPEALTATNGAQPDAIAEKRERLARLRALLERIEPAKRELLALRFASDLSSREIAAVVGKSEAAVKKQLTRTIAQLKEYYRDEV
jgi:RNA polymerase sigma-70 factor (ECF subfamily)